MDDTYVAVVSSDRGSSVPRMEELLEGLEPTWHVPWSQGAEYTHCGAKHVVECLVPTGAMALPVQRNSVLLAAQERGHWAVQFNDDLMPNKRFPTGLNVVTENDEGALVETSVVPFHVINLLKLAMAQMDAAFGGIATTTNRYFMRQPWSDKSFIMAHLMVMAPDCDERFDIEMGVKEDYDFTLQHLANRGVALRANAVLGNFRHAEKRGGGCSPYRTLAYEQMMADRLIERWGEHVIRNKRRPGEVLIKWKR